MQVQLITIPYFLGRKETRMGLGPGRILDSGARTVLQQLGHDVRARQVELKVPFQHEIDATWRLNCDLARYVREAREDGALPIVLAGNCVSAVGTLSVAPVDVGVIWLDAHGDFNTPAFDPEGKVAKAGVDVIRELVQTLSKRSV